MGAFKREERKGTEIAGRSVKSNLTRVPLAVKHGRKERVEKKEMEVIGEDGEKRSQEDFDGCKKRDEEEEF